jgi:hypothetical protein
MNINDLTIGQARELVALFGAVNAGDAEALTQTTTNLGLQIAVLDRGFVYVGNVSLKGHVVIIDHASCVRAWGTKRGLGELAANGPTSSTVLDPTPTVRCDRRAVIHFIACEEKAWKRA